ncbi:molybdenum cofactor guanylyltransferase [Phycisphaerales bacterium]|jgi:molybdopterin-guanine dinucleotide biosynthesis protein A|nr:molybdenum cofactor guanylyltransferase [Phycisphaerales bacterium]
MDSIQPIVLVGGKSTRFGRDKLVEPWNGKLLAQHPIDCLREVFGPRVKLVGHCNPVIVALADGVIPDAHPGLGPIGGIASALAQCDGPIFVLAGDMPGFSPSDIRRVARAAECAGELTAVWAVTDRPHPCAGVYLPAAGLILKSRIEQGRHQLTDTLPKDSVGLVPVSRDTVANVNFPDDLRSGRPQSVIQRPLSS